MVAILPDNQGSLYAELDRRLRDLENAARTGLSRVAQQLTYFEATAGDINVTMLGTAFQVTVGKNAIVMIHGSASNLSENPANHAARATFGGQVTPVPTSGLGGPIPLSIAEALATPDVSQAGNFHRFVTPWIPGTYTFQPTIHFHANIFSAAPTILPTGNCQVIVIPLD